MRNTRFDQMSAIVLGALIFTLTGCGGSAPSKFYQLSSLETQSMVSRDISPEHSLIVAVGPVRMPDYLDRPQIVTRSGKNELTLAEFDRWGGSLDNDVVRVLAADISAMLPADRFFVSQWSPILDSQVPVSYRVEVLADRFEGALGGSVTLRAQWAIFGKDKVLLFKKESTISEQANDNSYDALVDAMSKTLERLSREISSAISSSGQQTLAK
ncbi:MAG: membrane integrity-associated transporter subunit PqiC [Dissulfurispiraceae bacterium]|jgi:uncharacterized protein